MAPRRKRQKLEEDGEAVAAALAGVSEQFHQPEAGELDAVAKTASTKNSRSLFVRSLPDSATTESLAAFFSESYPLKHATLVTDPTTKKSKGYGFVTFADPEDALKARDEFNGSVYEGKKIKVELAEPRHRETQEKAATGDIKKQTPRKIHGKEVEPQATSTRLIIRNLPWSIKTSDQLITLFQSYGKIKQATLPAQKKGLSSGFGFVLLRGRKNAEKAIAGLNGKEVDGRTISVDWAVDKTTWQNLQAVEKKKLQDGKDKEDVINHDHKPIIDEDDDIEDNEEEEEEDGGVGLLGNSKILDDDEEGEEDTDEEDSNINDEIDEDDNEDEDDQDDEDQEPEDYSGTLFIRNLPFTATDETLSDHFSRFGPLRYARVVMDHDTNRSRGTAFVCFYKPEDAIKCLQEAPKVQQTVTAKDTKTSNKRSVLEDTQVDPFGHYTLEGRVLQISRAVDRKEATRLEAQGQSARETRDRDKRRLFLLSEGTVSSKSSLYSKLSQTEITMREDSSKQRQTLIKSNPSLHLSLTRLSIRNIPRHVTSKDLKALARQAVVGFATDVKGKRRQPLTKEELSRGAEEMRQAEHDRKVKGKGVVKQAKIVFEGREGGKVAEKSGAGKSRGYGFIEYSSHRWALMGLRWLNGHLVKHNPSTSDSNGAKTPDKPRRLIVEFAIENAQVVARRQVRHERFLQGGPQVRTQRVDGSKKRKAQEETAADATTTPLKEIEPASKMSPTARNIIGKKRAMRKARRSGK